jgi:signal transduction histidine kinase
MGTGSSRIPIPDESTFTAELRKKVIETKLKVVGIAGDGHEMLRGATGLKPDGAVVDIGLPDLNGADAGARVDFCTDCAEHKLAQEALIRSDRKLIEAQEKERIWIAIKLQEDIAQRIASLTVELDQWDPHAPESADELQDHTRQVRQRLSDIMKDVQALERENLSRRGKIKLEHNHSTVIGNSAAIRAGDGVRK